MKTKTSFVTVRRVRGCNNLHNFNAYLGETKAEEKKLLQNCMEGLEQIFGWRSARRCAKLIFAL